jgi:hypothetical protein
MKFTLVNQNSASYLTFFSASEFLNVTVLTFSSANASSNCRSRSFIMDDKNPV